MALKDRLKERRKAELKGFLNIGTIIFLFVFVYMIISFWIYITKTKVTVYQVTAGSLSGNYNTTALLLKSEKIFNAEGEGNVTYYAKEGSIAAYGSIVCSISADGAEEELPEDITLSDADINKLEQQMDTFSENFNSANYQNTETFISDIESVLLDLKGEALIESNQSSQGNATTKNGVVQLVTDSGYILYSIDGYEYVTTDALSSELFNQKNYKRSSLRFVNYVSKGDPVYKVVDDNKWKICFPIDKSVYEQLKDMDTIRFRIIQNSQVLTAPFEILEQSNSHYGVITMDNYLPGYLSQRFMDIEILMDRPYGLKIPYSAIDENVFYKIPKEFAKASEDKNGAISLRKRRYDEKKNGYYLSYDDSIVYEEDEENYYIDTSFYKPGDELVSPEDENKTFTIKETKEILGVYNINKGYTIFREVIVLDSNEEYYIVKEGATYGLDIYDHIVLDASSVKDAEILY